MIEFFLGYLSGIMSIIVYGVYRVSKLANEEADEMETKLADTLKIKKEPNEPKVNVREKIKQKVISVRDRLGEVFAITQRQAELQAAMDMPSQNALHSRHKNGILAELKNLEEKKHAILASILNDGIDPMINVLNEDGTKAEMKLSEFVARYNGSEPLEEGELPPPADNKKPAEPVPEKDEIDKELDNLPRKHGKFVVHTGLKGKKPPTNH